MKRIILFALGAYSLAACLPGDMRVPQSPLLPFLERKAGLIAYVGADGNVYVSDQSGGNLVALTDDAAVAENQTGPFRYYHYPTWSRQSNLLAFVGISGEQGAQTASDLYVADMDSESADKIYETETEHPFYLYWSPDNENLSFLSTSASGQSLILQTIPAQGGDRTILDTGSPYYWSWAPDGKTMVVHTGSSGSTSPPHMAFLDVSSSQVIEAGLGSNPASFQAPAWSPDGSRILLSRLNEEQKNEIILTDGAGAIEKAIDTFDVNAAFAWSHDSELFAYIAGDRQLNAGAIGTLHVIDLATSEDFFQDEDVIAFFWSPNSRKLAYFKPFVRSSASQGGTDSSAQTQQLLLQLHMLDIISGETQELFTFRPTDQFTAVLPYFDQYHQSATIWSPDNNNLVLSFLDSSGNPGIAIVAASGQLEPRLLAEGYLAFWSWK
ncbi:MAG TPA: hypothetical protein VI524_07860 [Anaerolineales bacterium]|nr:hypothetical protein [Anaerolineales bacterium]